MPNLNDQAHFSQSPLGVDVNRSTFDRSHGWKGTSKVGKLNVMFIDEILPGDTVDIRSYFFSRSISPFVKPVMDNVWNEQFFFFVPDRILWTNFKAFMGEGDPSQWTTPTTYTVPQVTTYHGSGGATRAIGDLADQMGIPVDVSAQNGTVNALPFRAYKQVWNDWFRDENLQDPIAISKGDTETVSSTYYTLLPTGRIHDYFGSVLPNTQKGDAVKIALQGLIPVTTLNGSYDSYVSANGSTYSLNAWTTGTINNALHSGTIPPALILKTSAYGNPTANANLGVATNGNAVQMSGAMTSTTNTFTPANLVARADAVGATVGIDVNALRLAVQTQRILEKMALGGSRYVEFVKSMFGVISPDARQQRPELLGYSKQMLNMSEVQQTSATSGDNYLGDYAANSKTTDSDMAFTHSFTEHGYLLGLFTIRENRTYSQGIDAMWKRKSFGDFYLPALAHIGEQPVYKYEIDAVHASASDIFGYQEAWASYRYKPSKNTCELRPGSSSDSTTFGRYYTFGDYYAAAPTLSDSWIANGNENVHRTLAITDADAPDFLHDVWFNFKHTRPMPVYSIPGLMDHF